jgi:hypothetical protein
MKDIVDELRAQCREQHGPTGDDTSVLAGDVRWRAAAEIESLRQTTWQPIETAPKDEGPILLFCPGLAGHVADEVVVGTWTFDPNRRSLGYWVSDVGALDPGFAETGPWIEYHELQPRLWARLPARPGKGN